MVLTISGIKKTYKGKNGDVKALDGVSMEIEKGQLNVVNGPSGCGKTTLMLIAGGLLYPDSGEIVLDGTNLYKIPVNNRDKLRAEKVGFVFQQFYLVPYINILENILIPSIGSGNYAEDLKKKALDLIDRFNLSHRINHIPGELSTGERQRVALARALINDPEVLFADEPTGNLDDDNAQIVLEHISGFARDGGAVLLVTHDGRIGKKADKTYKMKNGTFTHG